MSDLLGQTKLTPVEFEREVKASLERAGATLQSFVAKHRERIAGSDGEYEIDVTARFEPLGADFLVWSSASISAEQSSVKSCRFSQTACVSLAHKRGCSSQVLPIKAALCWIALHLH